jgi:hypothetical protein
MSRTRNAVLGSAFVYAQLALALVSGFVLFPVIVRILGPYDNGLWLITGESVGYLLLGDLGVFAVLPWLVAASDGAGDRARVRGHLADALAVGAIVGAGFVAVAVAVWLVNPEWAGVNTADWVKIRGPLTAILLLTGTGFPFRAFTALLIGLQDVSFMGPLNLVQTALTTALTASLVLLGFGLPGLAAATGLPPLLAGLVAGARTFMHYREVTLGWYRPTWAGCRQLIGQGVGAWLGSFGIKLSTASSSLVFAAIGRPEWATSFAATGKVAQVAQPWCWVLPGSGLVGLAQVHGEANHTRTRRVVLCLLLLYLLLPGFVVVGLLAANAWFVQVWIGPEVFAGNYVSGLIAIDLLLATAGGGVFIVLGVVGYRIPVGLTAIVDGVITVALGYELGKTRGLAGVAEAGLIAAVAIIPIGVYLLSKAYGIRPRQLLASCYGPWLAWAAPVLALSGWIGTFLEGASFAVVAPLTALLCVTYVFSVRPLIDRAPWPDRVRLWLARVRLVR